MKTFVVKLNVQNVDDRWFVIRASNHREAITFTIMDALGDDTDYISLGIKATAYEATMLADVSVVKTG